MNLVCLIVQQKNIYKNGTVVDTSKFAKSIDSATLKSEGDKSDIDKLEKVLTDLNCLESKVDKLYVDKLVPVPVDLSKISNIMKNDFKKDVYNAEIKDIEDKILDFTNLAINTTLNAKINEVKNETPSITNLATTAAVNA